MLPTKPVPDRIWPMARDPRCSVLLFFYAFGNILWRRHCAFLPTFSSTDVLHRIIMFSCLNSDHDGNTVHYLILDCLSYQTHFYLCHDEMLFSEPGPLQADEPAVPLPPAVPAHLRHGGDHHNHERQLHQGGATQRGLSHHRPKRPTEPVRATTTFGSKTTWPKWEISHVQKRLFRRSGAWVYWSETLCSSCCQCQSTVSKRILRHLLTKMFTRITHPPPPNLQNTRSVNLGGSSWIKTSRSAFVLLRRTPHRKGNLGVFRIFPLMVGLDSGSCGCLFLRKSLLRPSTSTDTV